MKEDCSDDFGLLTFIIIIYLKDIQALIGRVWMLEGNDFY
jgi:hypothetical protein